MPLGFDRYRMVDGQTPLAASYFNPVLQDLDLRLSEVEALRVSWLDAVSAVQAHGLARLDELVGRPMETINAAIAEIEQRIAALPEVVSQEEFTRRLQAALLVEAQARGQLQQGLQALHQTVAQMQEADVFPPMGGQAGRFLSNDGSGRIWAMPQVTALHRGSAPARSLLGVNARGEIVGMAPLELLDHAERAQLRTLTSGIALVRGLGVFAWEAGGGGPDDDETCFAAPGGVWNLAAMGPDAVQAALALHAGRILQARFAMTATGVAGGAWLAFDAPVPDAEVGDSVIVTPVPAVPAEVRVCAAVAELGTVHVRVGYGGQGLMDLQPGTWRVLVIKSTA